MSEENFPNELLRRARSLKGWSQEELAERVGTAATMVSRWERGIIVPGPYYHERLCAALGKTPGELGFVAETQPSMNAPHVCLVASRDDANHELVPDLKVLLQEQGIPLWSSTQLSRQGTGSPLKALHEVVQSAQVLLVIISPLARTSRYVQTALATARTYRRPVYGVWIEGEQWHACLPSDSGEVAMIDARKGYDPSLFKDLVETLQEVLSDDTPEPQTPPAPMDSVQPFVLTQRIRKQLLRRVESLWIKGVLNHSLHGAALIALRLQEQPEAVARPWHLMLQRPELYERLLPAGTSITEVYERADEELLILGAPGAGKTTLLLELTRELLARAEQDASHPLPFVFTLSSWATGRLGLAEWLVEELNTRYHMPRKLGRTLVEGDEIIALLDGLDEVDANARASCIEAINAYRWEHGMTSLVVCSRSRDYLAQATQLQLGCAVEIQPLTDQQIDDYLTNAGEPLEALRMALRQDVSLREITRTPLMLSILTLTYHGASSEDLARASVPTDRQRQVFEHYIQRVLQSRGMTPSYPSQHTIKWLEWLAKQMKRHGQTVFYIERMQPDWLPESKLHQFSYRALVRLGIGIVSGLIISLILGIAIGLFMGTGLGPRMGFVGGVIGGLVCGFGDGLIIALTSQIEREIRPAEVIVWSWRRLVQVRHFKRRLLVGISSGLTFGLLIGWATVGLGSSGVDVRGTLAGILIVVTIVMLTNGLTSGVSTALRNERDLTLPNQGMRQSVRNSIRIGIMSGLVGGSISIGAFFLVLSLSRTTFPAGPVNELYFFLLCGAIGGTLSGLIVGLSNGGIAFIQHLALRILLWRSHLIPWNYSRFLDYAAEHTLLSKVGGGYIFVHRLFLEYFVSIYPSSSTSLSDVTSPDRPPLPLQEP